MHMLYSKYMNKESLEAELEAIKLEFDKQSQIRNEAENEQVRLQGAYRTLKDLLEKMEETKEKKGSK